MLLGPPSPPPSALMYRIERRHAVRLPKHTGFASIATHSTPFWTPITHLWSLQLPDRDNPHVVLFHDRDDALAMTSALAAYQQDEDDVPSRYEQLKTVFALYFRQHAPNALPPPCNLIAVECDVHATLRWALPRGVGVMSIAKIRRHPTEMQFVVPMTFESPYRSEDDEENEFNEKANDDALRTACIEDFLWQID